MQIKDGVITRHSAIAKLAIIAEKRFRAHGVTEYDTNATYYPGSRRLEWEAMDEENDACRAAIADLPLAWGENELADKFADVLANHSGGSACLIDTELTHALARVAMKTV